MTTTTTTLYCRNHRRRETGLTCYKCSKPICAECARKAEIGYWCKECHRAWERLQPYPKHVPLQKPTWRFDWWGSLIGTALLTIGTAIGGPVGFVIGFILWRILMSMRR